MQAATARMHAVLTYATLARPLVRIRLHAQTVDELQHRLQLSLGALARSARATLNDLDLRLLRFGTGAHFVQAGRWLDQRLYQLWRAWGTRTLACERGLTLAVQRMTAAGPAPRLAYLGEHLRQGDARLRAALRTRLAHRRGLLRLRMEAIASCNPTQVLRRGYSITRNARTRELIRSVRQLRAHMRIMTEVADGQFRSTADDPRQPELFD
jgi:exodeoxyribonuclease VII large subunit